MKLEELDRCPGTLAVGYSTYSSLCRKHVFNAKKVNHVLPYLPPVGDSEADEIFVENRKRISVSGVQEKLSMLLDKNQLRLTYKGEQGEYLLKPIPRDLKKVDQVPANEHLTMQLANQLFDINTAQNAMVFFKEGTPAYLTKRFDLKKDGSKWACEDFASLAGKTSVNAGANYKYDYSYESLGNLLKKFVPAWRVEIEKLFKLLVFNYLFSNGDAHLKNFSLLESPQGDYFLSPAYDLLNTRLHVADTDFALSKGLFEDDFKSDDSKKSGHPSQKDFSELASRWGISDKRVEKILKPFLLRQDFVTKLLERSFLNNECRRAYLLHYQTKRNYLVGG